jgi:hypothetical protein
LTNDNKEKKSVIMIRTQISLTESDYKLVKLQSKKLGISFAEFIRIAIQKNLPVDTEKPWMNYYGFVESGNKDSSQNIDELVYGKKV